MTEQMFRRGFTAREECFRNHPGNEGRNVSLSALWELFHDAPSLPVPAVTDTLLQKYE